MVPCCFKLPVFGPLIRKSTIAALDTHLSTMLLRVCRWWKRFDSVAGASGKNAGIC